MYRYAIFTAWNGMIIDKFDILSEDPKDVVKDKYQRLAGAEAHVFVIDKTDPIASRKHGRIRGIFSTMRSLITGKRT